MTGVRRLVVSVQNLDWALGLYGTVLGLDVTARSSGLAFLRTNDDVELMLHERPVERGDAAVAIAFTVSDLDAIVTSWTSAGGTIIDPPARQPWGERMAVVRDVDGHVVCLCATESAVR